MVGLRMGMERMGRLRVRVEDVVGLVAVGEDVVGLRTGMERTGWPGAGFEDVLGLGEGVEDVVSEKAGSMQQISLRFGHTASLG